MIFSYSCTQATNLHKHILIMCLTLSLTLFAWRTRSHGHTRLVPTQWFIITWFHNLAHLMLYSSFSFTNTYTLWLLHNLYASRWLTLAKLHLAITWPLPLLPPKHIGSNYHICTHCNSFQYINSYMYRLNSFDPLTHSLTHFDLNLH